MRADRLLSLLLLLQTRGRMTAKALARELEVSIRTIYRDVEALSMAGVPIYSERGPGGGCALLDSYRTTLTGLNDEEVKALFMLSIPAPLADLGLDQTLKAALLKLTAALPPDQRGAQAHYHRRIYLDSSGWFQAKEPVPYLQTIQRAVWQDRRLRIRYRFPLRFEVQVERIVEPYGLVAKTSVWYLVAARDEQMRVYRISRVQDAEITAERFERSPNFELAPFWEARCAELEENRSTYPVTVRVLPDLLPYLRQHYGQRTDALRNVPGPHDDDGWLRLELPFESLEDARAQILAYGGAIEVIEPRALRRTISDYAEQILARYQPS